MTDFSGIDGIGKASGELLEAAGFFDVQTLAKAGVEDLAVELERANQMLRIATNTPTAVSIGSWIAAARKIVGMDAAPLVAATMPVNYEAMPAIMEMLAAAPSAIPLPAWHLVENQLAVADIPPAILLNRYPGDLEICASSRDVAVRALPRTPTGAPQRSSISTYVQLGESGQQKLEIDPTRLRSIADLEKVGQRIPLSKDLAHAAASREIDRIALLRAPLESTNRGRDPRSRRFVRGVLHSHPVSMTLGALVTLAMAVLLPLAIAVSGVLLASVLFPAKFAWVSPWLLAVPCGLPLLGGVYLIFGMKGRCRICTQRVFLHRTCLKNSKAHHIRGFGHIIPVSLHILLFRWFRCSYCGTSVRLKK
ncbi:MAG: DUF4332 domain-containing protein [Verrucomicrobia bacterium]|nr:MAG: DUF4332 domain-containing protein [Verrucomicrobiota bacterium]